MDQKFKRKLSIARDDPFRDIFMKKVRKPSAYSRQISQMHTPRGHDYKADSERSSPARLEG